VTSTLFKGLCVTRSIVYGVVGPCKTEYRGQAILRKYIRPVARSVGIQKRFGWHTSRHAYSTLPLSVGTEFKVMQEPLRHSSLRSTLDVYTQATPAKHAAQSAVVSLVFSSDANGGLLFLGQETAAGLERGAVERSA
jgi:hypothetical protein